MWDRQALLQPLGGGTERSGAALPLGRALLLLRAFGNPSTLTMLERTILSPADVTPWSTEEFSNLMGVSLKRCSVLARWTRMFALLICAVVLDSWSCTWYVPPSEPTFEIRDIADSASAVKHVMQDQEGNNVVVGDTAFFSRADLESVTADKNPEGTGSALNFTWNANCADRWTRYTASRVGKRIVIIANGIVLATPKILDPIKKPGIMLSLPDTDLRKAKKMAAELSPVKQ